MIKLEEISAGYGKKQVLYGVSASFQKGKITSVVGPNGCGKSTLLKSVLGIVPLTGGRVTADGVAPDGSKPREVARKIAYLAQSRSVPDMTVGQLVLHGRFARLSYPRIYRAEDREAAHEAMRRAGIADSADMRLAELSGGMRQSAYIAMALAQNTDYILLDEPNSSLDIANSLRLMRTLRELADGGKGVVTVLHDLTFAMEFSDEILIMKDGKAVMSGNAEEVCSSDITEKVFGVRLGRCETGYGFAYYYIHGGQNG